MRFESRLRKLEARARDRVAAHAAMAAIPKPTPEERRGLDAHALCRLYRQALNPRNVMETDEYRQLYAHYRRLPLTELVRQYEELKRRQEQAEAYAVEQRQRLERAQRYAEQMAEPLVELRTVSDGDGTDWGVMEEEADDRFEQGSGRMDEEESEAWRPAWSL